VSDLAAACGASEEAVLEALEAGRGYRTASLDAPDRDEQTLAESLGTDDPQFTHIEDRSVLASALESLSARDQQILRLRFVDGLTQSEIASRLGVSQMQISRLLAASLQSLRRTVQSDPRDD
jgi:RNA polymerase sigma-B factor